MVQWMDVVATKKLSPGINPVATGWHINLNTFITNKPLEANESSEWPLIFRVTQGVLYLLHWQVVRIFTAACHNWLSKSPVEILAVSLWFCVYWQPESSPNCALGHRWPVREQVREHWRPLDCTTLSVFQSDMRNPVKKVKELKP